jgi:hypothetical protein
MYYVRLLIVNKQRCPSLKSFQLLQGRRISFLSPFCCEGWPRFGLACTQHTLWGFLSHSLSPFFPLSVAPFDHKSSLRYRYLSDVVPPPVLSLHSSIFTPLLSRIDHRSCRRYKELALTKVFNLSIPPSSPSKPPLSHRSSLFSPFCCPDRLLTSGYLNEYLL